MPIYNPPIPPYFLLVAGLLMSLTCGVAFARSVQQIVRERSLKNKNLPKNSDSNIPKWRQLLPFPYLGIAIGACLFLASSLQVFGFSGSIAYLLCLPLTALTTWLVWFQLSNLLDKMERGSLKREDLDSLELRENIPLFKERDIPSASEPLSTDDISS